MKEYKYGMILRGFSIGCQPMNGLIDWQDSDRAATGYWSVLTYQRKLTDDEQKSYSLSFIGEYGN